MLKKIKLLLFIMIFFLGNSVSANYEKLAYDFRFKDLDGGVLSLSEYKGKIIIVINVASQCGFTNQYEDMQKVWQKYQDKGIVMLGVPSNDFGKQEPISNKEIKNLDKEIKPVDPVNTKFIPDTDSGYRKTKLYIETHIRNSSV